MEGIELLRFTGVMQNSPIVCYNILNDSEVQEILNNIDNKKLSSDSGRVKDSTIEGFNRNTGHFNIENISSNITKKLLQEFHKANFQYQFDLTYLIQIMYAEYYPSSKGLPWHNDIGSSTPFCFRKLSFSLGLNDSKEYKGGEAKFFVDEDNIPEIKLNKGDLLIFPSFMSHKVNTVTEGIRKTLIGFLGGRPFR